MKTIFLNEADDKVSFDTFEPTEKDVEVKADKKREEKSKEKKVEENSNEDNAKEDVEETDENPDEDLEDVEETDELENSEEMDESEDTDLDTEENPPITLSDNSKKIKLFEDYSNLLTVSKELLIVLEKLDLTEMSTKERNIYIELEESLKDDIEKIENVISMYYQKFPYKKLLTIYLYLKSSILTISRLLKKFVKVNDEK